MVIKYRITRSDIWQAYWRRTRLKMSVFRVTITLVLIGMAISSALDPSLSPPARVAMTLLLGGVAIAGSPIFPLLRFKADERILEIGPTGLSTTIGRRSGTVPWNQIARVESAANRIYIVGKTGDSFIVPWDAFSSPAEQAQFTQLAIAWSNKAGSA
jgi:hypothetical protein